MLLILLLGFFGWARVARIVRAQSLTLKQRSFVAASRVIGASTVQVLRRQLLAQPVGADHRGRHAPGPGTDRGRGRPVVPRRRRPAAAAESRAGPIGSAVDWISTDPMFLLFPGAALFLATLSLTLLGDGLRDVFDPRSADARRVGSSRRPLAGMLHRDAGRDPDHLPRSSTCCRPTRPSWPAAALHAGPPRDRPATSWGSTEPWYRQYLDFLTGIVAGRTFGSGAAAVHCDAPCFGYSFPLNARSSTLIIEPAPVTASIALGAAVLWLLLGVGAGVFRP